MPRVPAPKIRLFRGDSRPQGRPSLAHKRAHTASRAMEDQMRADTVADDGSGEKKPKPWDTYFNKPAPEAAPEKRPDGWTLIHDGRLLEDALWAAAAELKSDLLWGNLALPIDKTLEHLRAIDVLHETPEPDRSDEDVNKEAHLRRSCREMLELSTKQLEEMQEKKGEFGHEYRVVTAAWCEARTPWACGAVE